MELAFELLREASIRLPGAIGNTIGIVGALVIGDAAVSAHLVAPQMVIVVAITAIGSFTVPSMEVFLSHPTAAVSIDAAGGYLWPLRCDVWLADHFNASAASAFLWVPLSGTISARQSSMNCGMYWCGRRAGQTLIRPQFREPNQQERAADGGPFWSVVGYSL